MVPVALACSYLTPGIANPFCPQNISKIPFASTDSWEFERVRFQ